MKPQKQRMHLGRCSSASLTFAAPFLTTDVTENIWEILGEPEPNHVAEWSWGRAVEHLAGLLGDFLLLYWGPCREQHTHNKTTDTQPRVLQRVADVHRAFSVWENIWASRKMGCRLERSSHSFLHICCNLIDWNVPVIFLSDRCSLPDKSVFQVS